MVDYREGRIFERRDGTPLRLVRGPRPPSQTFADIKSAGGFTQINHPTIFPSSVPGFDLFCRGCPWDYTPEETGYERVDAIEIATGPSGARTASGSEGPNPFTVTAIDFYERALASGHKIAAVGVSDSHNGARTPNPTTQAPIGEATTVVRAGSASFTARVIGGDGRSLTVYRDGAVFRTVAVSGADFSTSFDSAGPGRYRLQLQRGSTIEAVSSPIYLEPGPGTVAARDCSPLRVRGIARRRIRLARRGSFPTRCTASGGGLRFCNLQVVTRVGRSGRKRVRILGRRHVAMTDGSGRLRVRLNRYGRRLVRRQRRGREVRLVFIASDADGASARFERRVRLVRPLRRR